MLRDIQSVGFIGVSFFFVLSGFVLAYNYEGVRAAGDPWFRSFAVARVARIYPVYLLTLAIMVPLDFSNSWSQTNLGTAIRHEGLALGLTLPMIQSWIPSQHFAINPPAWSLSDEAFFYLMFPIVLSFLARVQTLRTACLVAIVAFIIQVGAVPMLTPLFRGNAAAFPPVRLAEFVAGVAGGLIFLRHRWQISATWSIALLGASVGAIVFAMSLRNRLPAPLVYSGFLTPLFAATVFMLAMVSSRIPRFWAGRGWVFLGEASYSLYLLQFPVFVWLAVVMRTPANALQVSLGGFMIYLTLLIVVSAAVYQWFERPTRLRLKTVAAARVGHHIRARQAPVSVESTT